MTMELDTILCGDSLNVLKALPESSVHCCVTSPPYYGLRDYGMDAQIGREATPEEYISRLTAVFREVRRVLRPDGTLWVNIADSYCGTGSKGDTRDPKYPQGRNGQNISLCQAVRGCKQKDMIGIPWMLAFALRADGWYLRNDVIWAKGNPMPESTKDRCTRSHEHIFMFTKSRRYFYDWLAIAEPIAPTTALRKRLGAAWASIPLPFRDNRRHRISISRGKRQHHRRHDLARPGKARCVVYQHRALQGRAFCRLSAPAGRNLYSGGLSQGRHCP